MGGYEAFGGFQAKIRSVTSIACRAWRVHCLGRMRWTVRRLPDGAWDLGDLGDVPWARRQEGGVRAPPTEVRIGAKSEGVHIQATNAFATVHANEGMPMDREHARHLLDQFAPAQLAAVVHMMETMVRAEEDPDTLSNAESEGIADADE